MRYQSVDPLPVYFSAISYAPVRKTDSRVCFLSPGKPTTIEKTGWLEPNQMLVVEPYGIRDADSYTRKKTGESIHDYKGPGFAFLSATMEGPIIEEFPSRGHKLIFGNLVRREIEPSNPKDKENLWYTPKFEIISEDESADAAKAIKRLAAYAFRRAVTDEDLAPYLALFKTSVRRRKVSKAPCGRSSPPCSLPPLPLPA